MTTPLIMPYTLFLEPTDDFTDIADIIWRNYRGHVVDLELVDPDGDVVTESSINAVSHNYAAILRYMYDFCIPGESPPQLIWGGHEDYSMRFKIHVAVQTEVQPAPIRDGLFNCLAKALTLPEIDGSVGGNTLRNRKSKNRTIAEHIRVSLNDNASLEDLEPLTDTLKTKIYLYFPFLLNCDDHLKSFPIKKYGQRYHRKICRILYVPGHVVTLESIEVFEVDKFDQPDILVLKDNKWALTYNRETGKVTILKAKKLKNRVNEFISINKLKPISINDYDAQLAIDSTCFVGPYHDRSANIYTGETYHEINSDGRRILRHRINPDFLSTHTFFDMKMAFTQEMNALHYSGHPTSFGPYVECDKLEGPGLYVLDQFSSPEGSEILNEFGKCHVYLSDLLLRSLQRAGCQFNIIGASLAQAIIEGDIFEHFRENKLDYAISVGTLGRSGEPKILHHLCPPEYVKQVEKFCYKEQPHLVDTQYRFTEDKFMLPPHDQLYVLHQIYIENAMMANLVNHMTDEGQIAKAMISDCLVYEKIFGKTYYDSEIMKQKSEFSITKSFQIMPWEHYNTSVPNLLKPLPKNFQHERIRVHYGIPGGGKTTGSILVSRKNCILLTYTGEAADDKRDEVALAMPIQRFAEGMNQMRNRRFTIIEKIQKNYKRICAVNAVIIDQAQFLSKEEIDSIINLPEFFDCTFDIINEDRQTSVVSSEKIPICIETAFPKEKYPWIFYDTFWRSNDPVYRDMITQLYYVSHGTRESIKVLKEFLVIHAKRPDSLQNGVLITRYNKYRSKYLQLYKDIKTDDMDECKKHGFFSVESIQGESNGKSFYSINLNGMDPSHILSSVSRCGSFSKLYVFWEIV